MRCGRLVSAFVGVVVFASELSARERWTAESANAWYEQRPWLVGANFTPSTSVNQLEMWQAETFDPLTIDRELAWAASLGFNSMRVFLHHLLWEQDRDEFLSRVDRFLDIAEGHGMGVMLVLLDGVWDPSPRPGTQREPRPHVHNSGWVQSPGRDVLGEPSRHDELRPYVHGVVHRFRNDPRVHVWDLFNEPDNRNESSYGNEELKDKPEKATSLLEKVFDWAREAEPSQPLTAGVWVGPWPEGKPLSPIERGMLEQSDVMSFHSYGGADAVRARIEELRRYRRPILCTEYMARPQGSRFDPILQILRDEKVAAYNWGLVAGKTQTIYPWDSWRVPYEKPPDIWFHDIFRADGTPFDTEEVQYIRSVVRR